MVKHHISFCDRTQKKKKKSFKRSGSETSTQSSYQFKMPDRSYQFSNIARWRLEVHHDMCKSFQQIPRVAANLLDIFLTIWMKENTSRKRSVGLKFVQLRVNISRH